MNSRGRHVVSLYLSAVLFIYFICISFFLFIFLSFFFFLYIFIDSYKQIEIDQKREVSLDPSLYVASVWFAQALLAANWDSFWVKRNNRWFFLYFLFEKFRNLVTVSQKATWLFWQIQVLNISPGRHGNQVMVRNMCICWSADQRVRFSPLKETVLLKWRAIVWMYTESIVPINVIKLKIKPRYRHVLVK